MSEPTRSQRIIDALNQLRQFLPATRSNEAVAINVLNGANVTAVVSDDADSGMLFVKFPGGDSIQVIGDLYLDLQIAESARLILDSHGDGQGSYAKRSAIDNEHLRRKHDLG